MEIDPKTASWGTIAKTNAILADIYDAINVQTALLMAKGTGKRPQKPKRYPRPFKDKNEDTKHFGSGALPVNEFDDWLEKKRKEYAERKRGESQWLKTQQK